MSHPIVEKLKQEIEQFKPGVAVESIGSVVSVADGVVEIEGLEGAIERAKAYIDAGADMIFPEALESQSEFEQVGKALSIPLLANMTEFGRGPLLTVEDLGAAGFAAVLYPVTLLRLAMKAIEVGLELLADEGSQQNLLDLMQTREELYDLLDYDPAHPEAWRQRLGIAPEEC